MCRRGRIRIRGRRRKKGDGIIIAGRAGGRSENTMTENNVKKKKEKIQLRTGADDHPATQAHGRVLIGHIILFLFLLLFFLLLLLLVPCCRRRAFQKSRGLVKLLETRREGDEGRWSIFKLFIIFLVWLD